MEHDEKTEFAIVLDIVRRDGGDLDDEDRQMIDEIMPSFRKGVASILQALLSRHGDVILTDEDDDQEGEKKTYGPTIH